MIRAAIFIVVIALSVTAMIVTSRHMDRDRSDVIEAYQSTAFACGYLAGQRSIIASAGLPITPPADLDVCPYFKEIAASHGFTQP